MSTPTDEAVALAADTIKQAVANALASVTQIVSVMNDAVKAAYVQDFQRWVEQVEAHDSDRSNPPKPPMAYVVITADDATTGPGSDGPYQDHAVAWPTFVVGTKPVCDPLPVPDSVVLRLGSAAKIGAKIAGLFGPNGGQAYQKLDASTSTATIPGTCPDGPGFFRPVFLMASLGYYEKVG